MTRWCGETENVARGLWAEGKGGDDIAIILKAEFNFVVTRRGVLGKLNRLGLLGKKKGPSPCRGIKRARFAQAWAEHKARAAA